MSPAPVTTRIDLPDRQATDALAARLGGRLGPGDTILLHGVVGAGKSHFARALIQAARARAGLPPEDVPSPTFTLVQTYDAGPLRDLACRPLPSDLDRRT